jgi:alpha-tubulin suppressor-like RCC1 family protein
LAFTFSSFATNGSFNLVCPPPTPAPTYYLWAWGYNAYAELGLGNTTNRSSPVQVGALNDWTSISASGPSGIGSSSAIKTDGTLWSWGRNSYAALGLGNTTDYSSPKQVGSLTNWQFVDQNDRFCVAIKTNGTIWSWGKNGYNLGLGNSTDYSSPKQIGALTNWAKVSGGSGNVTAVKTDGTLWSWGGGSNGGNGDGDTVTRYSPVQIGALTTWSSVSGGGSYGGYAIKTDGTMWAWGWGAEGKLGLGDTANRSSPTQIGALTTWSSIAGGGPYHAMALKTDGTIWSWGNGGSGKLGLGDTNNRSSPVQIGALTTWSKIYAGGNNAAGIKTDGTLWSWGNNSSGRLGLGNTTSVSSPVQIGSLTTWANASFGEVHAFALAS